MFFLELIFFLIFLAFFVNDLAHQHWGWAILMGLMLAKSTYTFVSEINGVEGYWTLFGKFPSVLEQDRRDAEFAQKLADKGLDIKDLMK